VIKIATLQVSLTPSEASSSSLYLPRRKFRAKELLPHLNLIAAQIDFSAVALGWCSSEVIEVHQAQDLLKFTVDGRERSLKMLNVYTQLKRYEDRVPFFLRELLKSGEHSHTNQDLYEKLSEEMDFTDTDLDYACENSFSSRSVSYADM